MEYTVLTDAQRATIKRDRILQLEGEHYHVELLLQEATAEDLAGLVAKQTELARRIEIHLTPELTPEIATEMTARRRAAHDEHMAELTAQRDALEADLEGSADRP